MSGPVLPPWMFTEFDPVGVDLGSPASVQAYDDNQGTTTAKDNELLDRLSVAEGVFVDLGTGTGSLPVRAALRGAESHAVDVSENMISFARQRADTNGVSLHHHHAGFLSYENQGSQQWQSLRVKDLARRCSRRMFGRSSRPSPGSSKA